eukprot:TRINITY_DN63440_c0_g1_i1.p1 TRINITY_DN63440_c0_g1~~TRINITY_DN63440_c0_g1_i1.p1  ORF type:complete len:384 (+),score=14.84 TRINITY_DN63440_c0_g1_i1:157-1308(+)
MNHRSRHFDAKRLQKKAAKPGDWSAGLNCEKWVVITTINEPTKLIHQSARLPTWCLVVVLDNKTPIPYKVSGKNVVVLSMADQKKLPYRIMDNIPQNHFGRKNVGFMYAIAHGATMIYDTDDDNYLRTETPEEDAIPIKWRQNEDAYSVRSGVPVFNPYPLYGSDSWPRGFPLQFIRNETTTAKKSDLQNLHKLSTQEKSSLWVHQSLANQDPDFDAIYRLTRSLPVFFEDKVGGISPNVGTMTPYNAQATLHFKEAFWGLLLPITVHGRVSDIWRSYFTQRLMWDLGGRICFRYPWVYQDRNVHSYIKDFDSEIPLYLRAGPLVSYLQKWHSTQKTLPQQLVDLYIAMYRCQILQLNDVLLMFDWVQDLDTLGYQWPKLKKN